MQGETDLKRTAKGLVWRLVASFLLGLLWFTFVIVWLFFISLEYSFYQNLAFLVLSGMVVLGSLIAIWLSFGLRLSRQMRGVASDRMDESLHWLGWRAAASILVWISWFGFLIFWLFFFAEGYGP